MKNLLLLFVLVSPIIVFGEEEETTAYERLQLTLSYDKETHTFLPYFNPYVSIGGSDAQDQSLAKKNANDYALGFSDGVKAFSFYQTVVGDGRLYFWVIMQMIAVGEGESLHKIVTDGSTHATYVFTPNIKQVSDMQVYGYGYAAGINVAAHATQIMQTQ